ncbi:DUF6544 family protein [Aquimarina sp. MMG016]|uniref:DUF6544 family protein n=1 Tax=Aquimarina sp. MMG016 TaxID=2822690 RepID=UPI001B39DBCA|nr:DUF6544 family protein [Aquimarina sp. MMG016]MBQ4819699.1 hypothetical protein [Aquimarina sp. MMG016]
MTLIIIGITIVVIVTIVFIGISSIQRNVNQEKNALFTSNNEDKLISKDDLDSFPDLMKNYLINVKVIGKPKYCNAVFSQKGKIRTNPEKDWLPFTATQYISSYNPGFIWNAKAFPMLIRDKYQEENGEVKISLLGLKKIAQHSGPEVDQSSLGRYFGELIWFPIGFLDSDIFWEQLDTKTVKGVISKGGIKLEGHFIFDENGMIDSFKTKRYRDTVLENFIGEVGKYKDYDGVLIPETMTAIWDLKDTRLEYFKADIIDYNLEPTTP